MQDTVGCIFGRVLVRRKYVKHGDGGMTFQGTFLLSKGGILESKKSTSLSIAKYLGHVPLVTYSS